MFFGWGEVSTRPFSRKDLKDGGGDPLPGVSAGIRLKFRSCTVAGDKILVPPAQAADITGLLSYLRPFGIVPLPPSPLRFLPPFLC